MKTFTAPTIAPVEDSELRQQLQQIIDLKTKPLGALGRLETLGLQNSRLYWSWHGSR